VASRVGHLQLEVLVELLVHLQVQPDGLALRILPAAAALVEREARIDQVMLVLGQVFRAIEGLGRLLATGERKFHRPARPEALLLETDQGVGPNGGLGLVVRRPPGEEIAVLLHQGEGITGPVLALGLHHVDMGQQQHGLGLRVAARIDRHQAALLGMLGDRERVQVVLGYSRDPQPGRHFGRRQGAVTSRERGVGLHKFLVELAERRLVGPQARLRLRRECAHRESRTEG
jgi:hypothetical protein